MYVRMETEVALDVNEASPEDLVALTGISGELADAIIDARPFDSIDDLLRVPGIGRRILARLRASGLVVGSAQGHGGPEAEEELSPQQPMALVEVETDEEGGETVVNRNNTSEVFSQLLNRIQTQERGLLAPPPTEQERTIEQRRNLISDLLREEEHLLSVLQLMRPDLLKEAFDQIGDTGRELQQMAYLEWLHGTFQMLSQVAKLTQYSIEIQKKSLQDAGIDVSQVDQQSVPYTALTSVFQRLGDRLAQRAQGMQGMG